ncbi:RNA polymerase sigma factor [Ktedonospora formicarum]|uniref:DNA-directed RNA polymerase sigma-70 factor n=1 Tax=Ktedonospora formicarum TaxID=2778364 RepID=A0A8J3I450_9CHLR|nr:RNA polymerase sigma factor [Ktedonospora formicarum]GHO46485.1 DNA-directed RNA polymerase sigma-70 factor [Ktedonospora formicarum]
MQQPYMVSQAVDAELYQQYAPALFAYLLRNVSSREDAEDLLLDIFMAVLEKRSSNGLDDQRLPAWVWAVARNKVVDYHRRNKHRTKVQIEKVAGMLFENEEQAPDHVALKNEEYQQLHKTLKELPETQREIIQLRFGHGLSCGEIATVTQKSEGAIRMALHRTLKLLRTLYTRNEKGGML